METLVVNNASKKDLNLLIDIARKIGIDITIVPKKEKATQKISKQKSYNAITLKAIDDAHKGKTKKIQNLDLFLKSI